MRLKLKVIALIIPILLCSCGFLDGAKEAKSFVLSEVMCTNKEDYSKLLVNYKHVLSEDVQKSIRSRYISSPITRYSDLEVLESTVGDNDIVILVRDNTFKSVLLTVAHIERGLVVSYSTKLLYEV